MTGQPLSSAHQEYWKFVGLFGSEALSHKLIPKELSVLKTAFDVGYTSEYKGKISSAADLFFRLSNELETIVNMAKLGLKSETSIEQKKLVTDLVKQFNDTAYNNIAVTTSEVKKPFLGSICHPEITIIKTHKSEKLSTQGYYNITVSLLSNRTTAAYITGISNGSYTIKPCYTHDAAKGFLTQCLQQLKEEALNQGSTRLIVEFEIKNEKLFNLMQKCYPYLGKSETTHLGIKLESKLNELRFIHRFDVSLELPNGSMIEDRRLLYSRLVD